MQEFDIHIHSFQEIREFVELATVQPFRVLVGNEQQQVNAKSFIGMVSLDYTRPLQVKADCDPTALEHFQHTVQKFLA